MVQHQAIVYRSRDDLGLPLGHRPAGNLLDPAAQILAILRTLEPLHQPTPDGIEDPGLGLNGSLRDYRAGHAAIRIERKRHFEGSMEGVHLGKEHHARRRAVLPFAEIEL